MSRIGKKPVVIPAGVKVNVASQEVAVEGKLGKFFKDCCLVDQIFVKDDTVTVGEALTAAAKTAGGEAKVKRFVRFEIG